MTAVVAAHGSLFELVRIQAGDPTLAQLRWAYLKSRKLPIDSVSSATTYLAVRSDAGVAAILGIKEHPGRVLELCDLYAQPTRVGAAAMAAVVITAKQMIDRDEFRCVVGSVLADNFSMRRRFVTAARKLGVDLKPRTVTYLYGKEFV